MLNTQRAHLRKIARLGGLARVKRHGNPGTAAGRIQGGRASLHVHQAKKTKFKVLRVVQTIHHSEETAELLGILMGDGHLGQYQITMTTNSKTDIQHAVFVQKLFRRMLGVVASMKSKKGKHAVVVTVSSKNASMQLERLGMPKGNKMNAGMVIPAWVQRDLRYTKAFIRGLFDTDGCVYVDRHTYKKKTYVHAGWTITSAADTFIDDIKRVLGILGFSPTRRMTQKSVYLRKQDEIERYFDEIGTHNPKHLNRYQKFKNEVHGRVPKRS